MNARSQFSLAPTLVFAPALVTLALFSWAMWPCAVAADESPTDAAPEQAEDPAQSLRAADESFQTYAEARDRIRFRTLLAPDALYLGEELHRGFGAVLQAWNPLWNEKEGFSYRGEVVEVTVAGSGELGFTLGRVETRFRTPVDDEDRIHEGGYLTVWKQGPQGWRVKASGPLAVHPSLGESNDPRGALMAAWPELSGRIGSDLSLRWTPESTVYAESGELAWVFGTYEAGFGPAPADSDAESGTGGSGHFIAIWQKNGEQKWHLAAEALTPPELE